LYFSRFERGRFLRLVFAFLLTLLLAGCSHGSSRAGRTSWGSPIPALTSGPSLPIAPSPPNLGPPTRDQLRAVEVHLTRVASVKAPTSLTVRTGDEALYVTQRSGLLWRIRDGEPEATPLLDISDEVITVGEGGLFSAAFGPDASSLFLSFTDLQNRFRVVEYALREDGGVIRGSRLDVLTVPQPDIVHHAGQMVFGPDGALWISLGDGHHDREAAGEAQSPGTLLGKILRIDPTPSGKPPYTVPADNPFIHRQGERPEVYVYGLRNPWRFSFDEQRGDLWIGDVGQYWTEEIDYLPAGAKGGANFGWNQLEGTTLVGSKAPSESVRPLLEYHHQNGRCAVIGGFVYRGSAIEGLQGAYIYSDLCDGRIRALVEKGGGLAYDRDLGARLGSGIVSFGQDQRGELYVLSRYTGVYVLTET
jgi:glucose/arabinose dehydrogenase